MSKQKVVGVKVVEVGFGTTSHSIGEDNHRRPVIETFQSTVVPFKEDLSGGLHKRKSVTVEVDGNLYEVGPESHLAHNEKTTRVLNNSYVSSVQYKALLFGCLSMTDADVIELLVLGLPVNNMKREEELKELVLGEHELKGRKINIKNVWIVAQPMGLLLYYANSIGQQAFNEILTKNILTVDAGYGTLDWLFSVGLKTKESQSSSEDLGMSVILSEVKNSLSKQCPEFGNISSSRIDEAIWKNDGFITIAGTNYPFPVCINGGKNKDINFDVSKDITRVASDGVTAIKNSVGDEGDIDIIVAGGGSIEQYIPEIEKAFKLHDVIKVKNILIAVAYGLYLGGIQKLNHMKRDK